MKLTDEQKKQMIQENPDAPLWFLCHCGELHPWLGGKIICPELAALAKAAEMSERLDASDFTIRINAR